MPRCRHLRSKPEWGLSGVPDMEDFDRPDDGSICPVPSGGAPAGADVMAFADAMPALISYYDAGHFLPLREPPLCGIL